MVAELVNNLLTPWLRVSLPSFNLSLPILALFIAVCKASIELGNVSSDTVFSFNSFKPAFILLLPSTIASLP